LIDQCDVDEAMIVPARVDTMPNISRIEISHLMLSVLLTNNLQRPLDILDATLDGDMNDIQKCTG
jgi:hypothetical protein